MRFHGHACAKGTSPHPRLMCLLSPAPALILTAPRGIPSSSPLPQPRPLAASAHHAHPAPHATAIASAHHTHPAPHATARFEVLFKDGSAVPCGIPYLKEEDVVIMPSADEPPPLPRPPCQGRKAWREDLRAGDFLDAKDADGHW